MTAAPCRRAPGESPVNLAEAAGQLAPRVVTMEARRGAPYWRRLRELGLKVRLIHARFVGPYARGAKDDVRDTEAICEAALRPHRRLARSLG